MPEWGKREGITRSMPPILRSEFQNIAPHLDWGRQRSQISPIALKEEIVTVFRGKVVGRYATFFTLAGYLEERGLSVYPADYRFAPAIKQLRNWLQWAPMTKRPLVFYGISHTGRETQAHRQNPRKIQPRKAIPITPFAITSTKMANRRWKQHFRIDSSTMGDVHDGAGISARKTPDGVIGEPKRQYHGVNIIRQVRPNRMIIRSGPAREKTELRAAVFDWDSPRNRSARQHGVIQGARPEHPASRAVVMRYMAPRIAFTSVSR